MFNYLLPVALGAGLGAALRYLVIYFWSSNFLMYTAIWIVNVLGALAMGFLWSMQPNELTFSFWGTGVLGGLTTFSTMMTQALERSSFKQRLIYLLVQILAGLLSFYIGHWCGQYFI
ncbi:fluoride efflux transporter FluC [Convivina praedatoris]|uniref:Fluoride-specific ion channel FluC n=1 Tax=Convivina praedatoris TaxID=2880963 RepID=A0ABN8HEA8_9LACO|nr:CrcB family protein [Convivina sp. LMG 32447]CAH1855832.1 Putative fluoride ion transporter CrcB [Convivina sp. LMG 32447]CAH1856674.1 Putative fluoride ion transporter CrcB [Convivina sp. LMG 32447]CAH1856814.1 Putative fluoride ion transporter CrcB [Convivina sp. LMG 32447]